MTIATLEQPAWWYLKQPRVSTVCPNQPNDVPRLFRLDFDNPTFSILSHICLCSHMHIVVNFELSRHMFFFPVLSLGIVAGLCRHESWIAGSRSQMLFRWMIFVLGKTTAHWACCFALTTAVERKEDFDECHAERIGFRKVHEVLRASLLFLRSWMTR